MPQSLSQVYLHTVFSTKDRVPCLSDMALRTDLHAYMGGIMKKLGCNPVAIGGVADHVHILSTLSRTVTIAEFVKETKRISTDWLNDQKTFQARFKWQAGYGAFSVSPTHVDGVTRYIENQEEHHRTVTFKEEFIALLEKNGLSYDERWVWD